MDAKRLLMLLCFTVAVDIFIYMMYLTALQYLYNFVSKVTYLSMASLTDYQLCAEQKGTQSDSSCQKAPAVVPWMCVSQGVSMAITRCH